ncbi:phosphate ABC transporter substrate-binding protein PstS [uncultured Mucilaginibacter sp.]|uniref:phosphate ABC transporter substrate-binding protein PstS n=1 Tax=uncultured Mucilaginibacter sp. TaxID=797541 RepID=UPI0025D8F1CE|nr:phosphate ABC transporter substrate-binding protein PstS [uncultured Mucilaginibacter sp.]
MKIVKSLKLMVVAAAASSLAMSVSAQDLKGAGSSFVNPLFQKMFSQYTAAKVDYQSIGSGGGIKALTEKTVDFGDSDAPLNDEQTTKIGGASAVLHIPMTSGAVVVTYNIPGVTAALNLTGKDLADIYLGKVTKWNSPEITATNKGVALPDLPIVVIHRSDGSGTSFIFTDYLTKVNPDWASKVGKASAPNWPAGLGGKGSEGVAGLVKQTPGAIGYVELAYAIQNKMPYASMQNKGGKFIAPTIAATTLASNVAIPADTKVSVTNTDNEKGYPIASFTWALIYKEQNYGGRSKEKATQLLKMLWWNIHEGQKFCEALNYAPLSKSAVKAAEAVLKSATYDGKAIL